MNEDKRIVEGILKYDENAFNLLVDCYGAFIKAVVSFHLADFKDLQDDCINEILLSIWENMKSYDSSKNTLKNWIGAVSKYKCIDYKRKCYRNFCDKLDESVISYDDVTDTLLEEDIESILCWLKPQDRELFYRHYILGERVCEIAKNYKNENCLYNRLSRAKKRLRQYIKRSEYNEK